MIGALEASSARQWLLLGSKNGCPNVSHAETWHDVIPGGAETVQTPNDALLARTALNRHFSNERRPLHRCGDAPCWKISYWPR